jgi:uncharacterized membrane protein YhaH (DUF805 family)
MLGQVLRVDGPSGKGIILGEDRSRYAYTHAQVNGHQSLRQGQAVDFTPDGNEARDIYALQTSANGDAAREVVDKAVKYLDQNVAQKLLNKPPTRAARGALFYFTRGMTQDYAQFEGRARRAEYLKFTLLNIVAGFICLGADHFLYWQTGNASLDDFSIAVALGDYFPLCSVGWFIISIIPTLALMVRRYHDVGLSGWFVPLLLPFTFVIPAHPVILVLLESQAKRNRFGDSPKYDHAAVGQWGSAKDARQIV